MRRVLVVLCLTEITSYGVLYYAFPVLVSRIGLETGWSSAMTTAAFTTGLVVSGLVGVPVGRRLDRDGPRIVMTGGSVLGVAALVLIALAPSLPWFFASWVLAGTAMAGVFYAPAFAAITRWYGAGRVSALTTLTLVAGLASTVFAPLTAALLEQLGWRGTYLVLAAVLAAVTVPAHALGLTRAWPDPVAAPGNEFQPESMAPTAAEDPRVIARSRRFIMLALAFSLSGFALTAVAINLVPLLVHRGLSISTAALALGLGGAGQVAGRFGYAWFSAHSTLRTRTGLVLLAAAATTLALAVLPGPAGLLVGVSVLAGTARGIFTLLQATAVSDRWGIHHFGRLNGLLSAPITLARAVAPAGGAALAGVLGGYPAAFGVLAVLTVVATGLAIAVTPRRASA